MNSSACRESRAGLSVSGVGSTLIMTVLNKQHHQMILVVLADFCDGLFLVWLQLPIFLSKKTLLHSQKHVQQ
jgi:hypothetical protein